ncbi:hypothetical protein H6501_04315 [Candidatus Woesearchaeota archaeon]|nr:hypothetical protein [Candidatus Woesearchaeota archaeon]
MYKQHKSDYHSWLEKEKLSRCYLLEMKRVAELIFCRNLKEVADLVRFVYAQKSPKYYILGFRKWVKYCEEFDLLPEYLIDRLKKKIKTKERAGIDSYVSSKADVDGFLGKVSEIGFADEIAVKILLESGCRVAELREMPSGFDESKVEVRGDIVTYSLFHVRGKKQAFYLFFTLNTYELLFLENMKFMKKYNIEKLKTHIKRHDMLGLKYLSKYHFTLMLTKGVSLEVANFIQGRVSQNIGFQHYAAKKELALLEYKKLFMIEKYF